MWLLANISIASWFEDLFVEKLAFIQIHGESNSSKERQYWLRIMMNYSRF